MCCEEDGTETAPDAAGKLTEEEAGSGALPGDCPAQADSRNASKNTGNMDLYFRMSSLPSARFQIAYSAESSALILVEIFTLSLRYRKRNF